MISIAGDFLLGKGNDWNVLACDYILPEGSFGMIVFFPDFFNSIGGTKILILDKGLQKEVFYSIKSSDYKSVENFNEQLKIEKIYSLQQADGKSFHLSSNPNNISVVFIFSELVRYSIDTLSKPWKMNKPSNFSFSSIIFSSSDSFEQECSLVTPKTFKLPFLLFPLCHNIFTTDLSPTNTFSKMFLLEEQSKITSLIQLLEAALGQIPQIYSKGVVASKIHDYYKSRSSSVDVKQTGIIDACLIVSRDVDMIGAFSEPSSCYQELVYETCGQFLSPGDNCFTESSSTINDVQRNLAFLHNDLINFEKKNADDTEEMLEKAKGIHDFQIKKKEFSVHNQNLKQIWDHRDKQFLTNQIEISIVYKQENCLEAINAMVLTGSIEFKEALRLFILQSKVKHLNEQDINRFESNIVNSMGFKHLATLLKVKKLGLLDFQPSLKNLSKPNLIIPWLAEKMTYPGWSSIVEDLKILPGSSNHISQYHPNSEKTSRNILLVSIGGLRLKEVDYLRKLETSENGPKLKFYHLTTGLITRDSILENL